jgi:hypothetical protein
MVRTSMRDAVWLMQAPLSIRCISNAPNVAEGLQ